MPITDWSVTPSENNAAPPVGAPEGMAAADVNNTMRQMMADIKLSSALSVNTIAELKALDTTRIGINNPVNVLGYNAAGDDGGGTFIWNSTSTTADNGGTVIQATGVVTGRWIRIIDGLLSIKAFGARGDGSTDDRAAFAAAMAAVDEIYVPAGDFVLAGISGEPGIEISRDGFTLIGAGKEIVTLIYTSAGTLLPAINVDADNVTIRNIGIDGTANATQASETIANCHGIDVVNQDFCEIDSVKIVGGHFGINLDNTTDNPNDQEAYTTNRHHNVHDCVVTNMFSACFRMERASHSTFYANDGSNSRTDGFKISRESAYCRIIGNTATGNTRDGFDVFDGLVDSVFDGNVAMGNTLFGYEIKGTLGGAWSGEFPAGTDYVVRNTVFSNNLASRNTLSGFSVTSVRNTTFVGNTSVSNGEHGFTIGTVQGCQFSGCMATRNAEHGYELDVNVSRTTFTGCNAIDNSWVDGTTQNGSFDGFFVSSGSQADFVGCHSINGTTAGHLGGQGYGFSFQSASGSFMTGCNATVNVTGDIENQANVTISNTRGTSGAALGGFGGFTASADAPITGSVEFTDLNGTTRKLATIA